MSSLGGPTLKKQKKTVNLLKMITVIDLRLKKSTRFYKYATDWQHSLVKVHEPRLYKTLGWSADLTDVIYQSNFLGLAIPLS